MNDGLSCAVCGTRQARVWRVAKDNLLGGDDTYTAVRCVRCGLIRLQPRPSDDVMRRAYSTTTYARAEDNPAVEDADAPISGLAERLDTFFDRQAERAAHAFGNDRAPGRVLDVGCGDGRFLAAMQARGWSVEGLETDGDAARLAARRTGATVHETYLENAPLAPETFDMVSLLHVLEHVPDPRETLTRAFALLKPGGLLLVAVPNAGSAEAKLFRTRWYPLDLPRHFWGFTPATLTRLAETSGFRVQSLAHFPFLFGPQSVRYVLRGTGAASGASGAAGPKAEGGGLRTRLFTALLTASEKWGRSVPGEVMELAARKPASRNAV